MRLDAVLAQFSDVGVMELTGWVQREPGEPTGWVFQDLDVARVRLIHDLRRDLDVAEEAMPLVLSLLDQVYELRSTLKSVVRAVGSQPPAIRQAVLSALDTSAAGTAKDAGHGGADTP